MLRDAPQKPVFIDAVKLMQALESFAGRVSSTNDPNEHCKAAQTLQKELKKAKQAV